MLRPVASTAFKRDVSRIEKRGRDTARLERLVALLCEGKPLPARRRDHPLEGDRCGFRDARIEPDRLVIYRAGARSCRSPAPAPTPTRSIE